MEMAIETGIDLRLILDADDGMFATLHEICAGIWEHRKQQADKQRRG